MENKIPDKLYFKIGEVARIAGVKPHVLRYWESEFAAIAPVKSRSNQRLYRRDDIVLVLKLKALLYEQGYTISGARKRIKELSSQASPTQATNPPASDSAALLREIRDDLLRLRAEIQRSHFS